MPGLDLAFSARPTTAVARTAILDRRQRVVGYELRFGAPGAADARLPPRARDIGDVLAQIGLDAAADGSRAFLKVSRSVLLEGVPVLPSENVVIEVGSDVEATDEIVRACGELREAGYAIALDGFVLNAWTAPLLPFANYLKIDCRDGQDSDARARTLACLRPGVTALIATGVETFEAFEAAAHDGFTYFQGFFFGRPLCLPGRQVPGHQLATLRLLRALNDPNLSVGQLDDLVSHDAALCYRILRTVNSAAFGLRRTVQTMHDALLLLGRDAVRRWVTLWAIAGIGEHGPSELVVMATVRARCCELLAGAGRADQAGDAFLLGMCSLLDAMLDRPMADVVAELPLEEDTRRALCGRAGVKRSLLDCVIAYEQGDWPRCALHARAAGVDPALLPAVSAEALRWAHELRTAAQFERRH